MKLEDMVFELLVSRNLSIYIKKKNYSEKFTFKDS